MQTFGPWAQQRIRLAADADHLELTWTVGPVPVQDGVGKEVISRLRSNIQNKGECFTDANGREMLCPGLIGERAAGQSWRKGSF